MNDLPRDPVMLMSFVNMKLRDQYDTLEDFCQDYGLTSDKLQTTLAAAGFQYSPENKRFW